MKDGQNDQSLEEMIADYMEKGFLDNIIDMFKYDKGLHEVITKLMKDERLRVRVGAIALIESLKEIGADNIEDIADSLVPLLKDENPVVRGDAAYSLGIFGFKKHIPFLRKLFNDDNPNVREIAQDSVEEIRE